MRNIDDVVKPTLTGVKQVILSSNHQTSQRTLPEAEMEIFVSQKKGSDSNRGTLKEPFETLQKAASIASDGDTIKAIGGYDGNWSDHSFLSKKSLVVNGELFGIRARELEGVTFMGCSIDGFVFDQVVDVGLIDCEIKGITRIGNLGTTSENLVMKRVRKSYSESTHEYIAGLEIRDTLNVIADACVFVGMSTGGDSPHYGDGYGLVLNEGCQKVTVLNSFFAECEDTGLWLKAGGMVSGCLFIDNRISLQQGQALDGGLKLPQAPDARVIGNFFLGGKGIGAPFVVVQHTKDFLASWNSYCSVNFKQQLEVDRACIRLEDWLGDIDQATVTDNFCTWDIELLKSKGPNKINYVTRENKRDIVHYDLTGLAMSRHMTPRQMATDHELTTLSNVIPLAVMEHHERLRGSR